MSYGKSALLERRIRALVRETAALLREAEETKINSNKIGKPYKIQGYVVKAISPLSYVYFIADSTATEVGTSNPQNSEAGEWNKWAGLINSASGNESNEANGFISSMSDNNQVKINFVKAAPAATTTPSATKASTALKEIQKLLDLTTDGIWGKQTAAGWEGFIAVAKRKVPSLPDGTATNWKGTAPSVTVGSTKGFKPDYTGMLAFMKAVNEISDPGGSAVDQAATSSTTASPAATAGGDNIVSKVTTQGPVRQGEPVDITSTYTSNGERLDINDIVVTVNGTGDVEGVSKVKNPVFPTGRNGKVKVNTNDLAPGTYKATVTGKVNIGGERIPKSSNEVTFTVT